MSGPEQVEHRRGRRCADVLVGLAVLQLAGRLAAAAAGVELGDRIFLVGLAVFPPAAALAFWRVRTIRRDRVIWTALGAAILLYLGGSWTTWLSGSPSSGTTLAQLLWLAAYVAALVGLWALTARAVRPFPLAMRLDAALGGVALMALIAFLVNRFDVTRYDASVEALGLTYPALDVIALMLIGWVVWLSAAGRASVWRWMLAGTATLLVGDVVLVFYAANDALSWSSLSSAFFPVAVACYARGAWCPPIERARPLRVDSISALTVPACAAVVLIAVIVASTYTPVETAVLGPLVLIGLLLGIVRAILVYRQLDELKESRRFEQGFEDAGIGMLLLDGDGRIRRVNDAMAAIIGRAPAELIGERFVDHLELEADPDDVERALGTPGTRVTEISARVRREDQVVEVVGSGDVAELEDGTVQAFVQARDVTAERRADRFARAVTELTRYALDHGDVQIFLDTATAATRATLDAAHVAITLAGAEDRPLSEDGVAPPGGDPGAMRLPVRPRSGRSARLAISGLPATADPIARSFAEAVANLVASALDRARAEEASRHDALHDPLTGLANRARLGEHLRAAVAAIRHGGRLAVLVVDLDRFKDVNDSHGHGVGDELLVTISRLLVDAFGDEAVVARLGGDEFVICVPESDEALIAELADQVARMLSSAIVVGTRELYVGASIGIVVADAGATPETLLRDADTAMYHAKQCGGARHHFFDEKLRAAVVSRTRMEHDLRGAVGRGELSLLLQPQVTLDTGLTCGFEALLRWTGPDGVAVSPAEFVPLAEGSGMIEPIGDWVLEQALAMIAEIRMRSGRDLTVSVNVSGRQLDDGLPRRVGAILERQRLPATALCLELTESLMVTEPEAVRVGDALREIGVRLSLDDFGTGFSSLAALQRQRVDELKIDRSMIEPLGTSRSAESIARATVQMASALGVEVVAEGIEDEAQLAMVLALGCEIGQGYLFAAPLTVEQALARIDTPASGIAAIDGSATLER